MIKASSVFTCAGLVGFIAVSADPAGAAVIIQSRSAVATVQAYGATPPPPEPDLLVSTDATGDFSALLEQGAPFSHTPPSFSGTGYFGRAAQDSSVELMVGALAVTAAGQTAGQVKSSSGSATHWSNGESSLTITFEVTGAAADYAFDGSVYAGPNSPQSPGSGTIGSYARLTRISDSAVLHNFLGGHPLPAPFDVEGQLLPDLYVLELVAMHSVQAGTIGGSPFSASFTDVNFTVTQVPEPASLALLATGLGCVLRRGQSRA